MSLDYLVMKVNVQTTQVADHWSGCPKAAGRELVATIGEGPVDNRQISGSPFMLMLVSLSQAFPS